MIHEYKNALLLRRHQIKLFYIFGKFLVYLFISMFIILVFVLISGYNNLGDSINQSIFMFFIVFINIITLVLILDIIAHFNNLIYINDTHIYIIQSWLLIKEDIEIIELNQVTKVNILCQGFLANAFSYGKVIIEQQRTETRPLFYIPEPYRVMSNIRAKMEKLKSVGGPIKELTGNKFDDSKIFGKK